VIAFRRLAGRQDGSTLLLTIFYGLVATTLILLVAAATSLYLERKRLFTLADGAALAAAESFTLDTSSGTPVPRLDSSAVADATERFLAIAPHDGFEGFRVGRAVALDDVGASVTLMAYWRPPVITLVLPAGVPIKVTAEARAAFGRP
jgi:hypothetical protein